MKTSIAVVGPPRADDLVALLRDTGAPLVTTATDPALVRQAVAQLDAKHVGLVWLVDPADGLARTWVELQAGRGSSVLAIAEPGTEIGFTTRLLPLSATANDLLAAFGKPGLGNTQIIGKSRRPCLRRPPNPLPNPPEARSPPPT